MKKRKKDLEEEKKSVPLQSPNEKGGGSRKGRKMFEVYFETRSRRTSEKGGSLLE